MLSTTDIARVYETILSIAGMNEIVMIDLKITRRNVLLLHIVIERGVHLKDADDKSAHLMDVLPPEIKDELKVITGECLHKAGVTGLQ